MCAVEARWESTGVIQVAQPPASRCVGPFSPAAVLDSQFWEVAANPSSFSVSLWLNNNRGNMQLPTHLLWLSIKDFESGFGTKHKLITISSKSFCSKMDFKEFLPTKTNNNLGWWRWYLEKEKSYKSGWCPVRTSQLDTHGQPSATRDGDHWSLIIKDDGQV